MDVPDTSGRDRRMKPLPIYPKRTARRHPRVPADFSFELWHPGGGCRLRAKNLSMTGMLARDERRVPEGLVRLELPPPDEGEPVRIEARAFRRPDGLALHFLDLDLPAILTLARHISPHL